ncbi:helix-turn-helix transcriptional regulator [Corynebacterium sp. ES2794-CONJ1]|uniref:heat shock protein transcriptional repressor HspR n=1 Tax=unclassified Corynebacterium TaxID=2624378 RepID=UPI002169DB5B|nr:MULTISPECIES: helix-turn-helix transcriptional regulator [unclassified Corynebacterium]MCS4490180.1 helix-turn-helix transcriptional regulator [Corynebacterium sp. ES2775-CONJ]MCS4492009.1 helix-turn-helix transcriptional regulator [Corynebacterium sp. ES2715-CONJ3]MCS4532113.1 helix-turn-helix transcriptional regulator [Corynebacterium sp. ES2730-CONJ]MCU9519515.1 helix-turn-helix transcriptional regulator [Corynebacterium sp. ES2794-CONJ1]
MGRKNDNPNFEDTEQVFVISVAAELCGMHAQTLRTYDRLGIVTPQRTSGGGRRYSYEDVELLRTVQRLSQEDGVNLAGIKAIIELKRDNDRLRAQLRQTQSELTELQRHINRPRGEIVHVPRSTAVVMWEPRRGKRR